MPFDDNILLKLKRDYRKDEAIKLLLKEITDLKFKIGELTSENSEYKYKNHQCLMKNNEQKRIYKDLQRLYNNSLLEIAKLKQ